MHRAHRNGASAGAGTATLNIPDTRAECPPPQTGFFGAGDTIEDAYSLRTISSLGDDECPRPLPLHARPLPILSLRNPPHRGVPAGAV